MNLLNQKLKAIRIQKAIYEKKIEEEKDQEQLNKMTHYLQILDNEENECLKQLGAYDLL